MENFNNKIKKPSTMIELVSNLASQVPNKVGYTFLKYTNNNKAIEDNMTYQDLYEKARSIGAILQVCKAKGEQALLVYPPGLDYIAALFGCFYAGVRAVPTYPPMTEKFSSRFLTILADAQAKFVLTTSESLLTIKSKLNKNTKFSSVICVDTSKAESRLASNLKEIDINSDTIAFLQYTSGSTSIPKGVIMTHGNIIHNLDSMKKISGCTSKDVGVSWLPQYHDMGLVGCILQSIFLGAPLIFMSPVDFLQNPYRWLQAISNYRGTVSGAPNFGYDFCIDKITEKQKEQIDLSSWSYACTGAEPIRANTIERFSEAFRVSGFKKDSFTPGYGLAESTFLVSGIKKGAPLITKRFKAEWLEQNIAKETKDEEDGGVLVSNGVVLPGEKLYIVDPDSRKECDPGSIGEIWVSSDSVSQGYLNNKAETEKTFNGYLVDSGEGPFLQTGDLGFFYEGQLYVTGRIKDLIIIRGLNYYPQDIEYTVEESHPSLRKSFVAAFSVDINDEEQLVIAQEVKNECIRNLNVEEVVKRIRKSISNVHGLQAYAVILCRSGSISKTPSGKIQRRKCKADFLSDKLIIVGKSYLDEIKDDSAPKDKKYDKTKPAKPKFSYKIIEAWLINEISKSLKIQKHDLDYRESFSNYGLSSKDAVALSGDLERWLDISVPPTIFYDYPTMETLCQYLVAETSNNSISDQSKSSVLESNNSDGIAVIGIGCRFPGGANNPEAFWKILSEGIDTISMIKEDRCQLNSEFNILAQKGIGTWGGYIEEVDQFDAQFFGISPLEADYIDPQQRILLEVSWEALEHAGKVPAELSNSKTGVFIGISNNDYIRLQKKSIFESNIFASTGNALSIAANRISYTFNFCGPSMAIDTACSSSLVAVHNACNSLKNNECDLALAGGVNLILSPDLTVTFSEVGMLASDGHCKTFDASADGYVRGEGCGIVVLKRLTNAMKDNDRILAIIRGAAVNQDGRSNGLTAPNGPSQVKVIQEALKNAKVLPSQISYIETHGTGTSLGDPIEVNSISKALSKKNSDKPCWIGSVKTNIGHLEASAGIAGFIKVVLSLWNKKLPPHLNLNVLNPLISIKDTSLLIPKKNMEWKEPELFAGISSFGFGGTNVHMIMQNYKAKELETKENSEGPYLFVLSAKNQEILKKYAKKYISFLHKINIDDENQILSEIAYASQTERDAMKVRLAVVASSISELIEKLSEYCEDKNNIKNLYKSNLKNMELESRFSFEEEEIEDLITNSHNNIGLCRLAEKWVNGVKIDWKILYRDNIPIRTISIPTYPFARECYWIPKSSLGMSPTSLEQAQMKKLHPLIGCNTSNFKEHKFTTAFTGDEFYLRDHIVGEQKLFPGMAHLEMGRAAGEIKSEKCINKIQNIKWSKPIVVDQKQKEVNINLYPNGEAVDYEITSSEDDIVINSQGKLIYKKILSEALQESESIDFETIRKKFEVNIEGKEFYTLFHEAGSNYGISFRPISEIYHDGREALGCLNLPEVCNENFREFVLHPSIMDGVLQILTVLIENTESTSQKSYQPYSLEEIEILSPLSKKCYAYVTPANESESKDVIEKKYNIVLVDDQGKILIKMKNFLLKKIQTSIMTSINPQVEKLATIYMRSIWEKSQIEFKDIEEKLSGLIFIFDVNEHFRNEVLDRFKGYKFEDLKVILVKPGKIYRELNNDLFELNPENHEDYHLLFNTFSFEKLSSIKIIHMWSNDNITSNIKHLRNQLNIGIYSVFNISKTLMMQKYKNKVEILFIYHGGTEKHQPQYAAISGFGKTLHQENNNFLFKAIELSNQKDAASVLDIVLSEFHANAYNEVEILYDRGNRYIKRLEQFEPLEKAEQNVKLKEDGVYLITGGAGGLGMIFTKHFAKKVRAKFVLTGRSDLSLENINTIKKLESLGSEIVYMKSDLSNQKDVNRLITDIITKLGGINGIIHCAGIIRNSYILKKTKEEMADVFGPKVYGTAYLDEATKNENLDFFVLFSSVIAEFGNAGQSDYAFANSYLDNFSKMRESFVLKKKRSGYNFSINWPLWENGGMKVTEDERLMLSEITGLEELPTHEGIKVLETIFSLNIPQCFISYGKEDKLQHFFNQKISKHKNIKKTKINVPIESIDIKNLLKKTEAFLIETFGELLKLPVAKIEADVPFEEYGINSILIMKFNLKMENVLGPLSKTLLFEYQTINELSDFLVNNHTFKMIDLFKLHEDHLKGDCEKSLTSQWQKLKSFKENYVYSGDTFDTYTKEGLSKNNDIAIIGISGRYPGAENINQYWENLILGKDSVTEIPKNRWNGHGYNGNGSDKDMIYCKWGGFLKDVDKFDPLFFNIPPKQADIIDPQERLFLEVAWSAFEDAGYTRAQLAASKNKKSSVGVFVGVTTNSYQLLGDNGQLVMPLTMPWSIANRVSFAFNFQGPSMPVDTACSSSLTAVHMACESLKNGECNMAIAGGVNLYLHPSKYMGMCQMKMLSATGRCHSFGQGADGFVPGEGVGAILLKPLKLAEEDRDHIYGIIKASSINHGGRTNGYTVPNPKAQADLILDSIEKANINPRTISYFEAHGTGTSLGDPIEINGLMKAYNKYTEDKQYCSLGSVKSNIGHLESAAGIAGLTKILLQMRHRKIVPSLHSKELNPNIDFDESPFYVQQNVKEWSQPIIKLNGQERKYPRRAGLSSFGAGGANAHLIIEEYKNAEDVNRDLLFHLSESKIIVLSAKNEDRLKQYANNLIEFLDKWSTEENKSYNNLNIENIAYTLQIGRESMTERLAIIVSDIQELIKKLSEYYKGKDDIQDLYIGNIKANNIGASLLMEGKEGEELTKSIVKNKNYNTLAKLWVSGVDINWNLLYQNQIPKRISLPTYPFAKERCWLPEIYEKTSDGENENKFFDMDIDTFKRGDNHYLNQSITDYAYCIFKKSWKESGFDNEHTINHSGTIILLVNEETRTIAKKLFQQSESIKPFFIDYRTEFENRKQLEFSNGLNKASYGSLLYREIMDRSKKIIGVIDLSDLYDEPLNDCKDNVIKIKLLQALIKNVTTNNFYIFHFTKGLQTFQIEAPTTLAGSNFAGLIKMLSSEYSNIVAKTIDVDFSLKDVERIENIIFHEMDNHDLESEICYRSNKRYLPFMKEISLEDTNTDNPNNHPDILKIDFNKVVVITGGTGGIGGTIADHLAKKGFMKLVLMGIQKLPPRDQWESFLKKTTEDNSISKKIKKIIALEKNGAKVDYYSGSLTNYKELNRYFGNIREEFGEIGGVIHCAGTIINENPAFIKKNIQHIEKVFEPKIDGLKVLHQIFLEDKLHFFILFSSVSSVIPVLATGISDYSIANSFMDYFAAYQNKKGFKFYKSINWPSWKEIGMGEVRSIVYNQLGLISLSNAQGLFLLDKALNINSTNCIMPCVIDKNKCNSDMLLWKKQKHIFNYTAVKEGNSSKVDSEEKENSIRILLRKMFSEELRISEDNIDGDIEFNDYGVDSILLVELVGKIEDLIGENINPSIFLEYPTLNKLSGYLTQNYSNEKINNFFSQSGIAVSQLDEEAATQNTYTLCCSEETSPRNYNYQYKNGSSYQPNDIDHQKIAVIGMACNFPDAPDIEMFWENLQTGKESITEIPETRWDIERYYNSEYQKNKSISKWGGFLENIEYFDPQYFSIREKIAHQIDPLIRQFLEVSVQCVRNAGYESKELTNKKVGVFVGTRSGAYSQNIEELFPDTITGVGQNFVAAHVSHFFNLKGPSLVVDTACSSSLASIHLACQSLITNESKLAIAGGVDILNNEIPYLVLSEARVLSPDGKCRTFDEKANGIVLGEGAGAVLLKPLNKAISDGDQIFAVIDSSSLNNDGHTMGITTPNPETQKEVIRDALKKGHIDPESIEYVETHGTGTMIGDPIELKALTEIYQQSTSNRGFCAVGSVKTNIGHLLSAAGIASFIKSVLCVHHKKIVPTLNCNNPNPRFKFEDSPFYINKELKDWAPQKGYRRAGISSFGFGGTNSHIIISELDNPLFDHYKKNRNPLPLIEFNRKRYWFANNECKNPNFNIHKKNDSMLEIIDETVDLQNSMTKNNNFQFSTIIKNDNYLIKHHRVHGIPILPGVTFIDLIYRILAIKKFNIKEVELRKILFKEPISTNNSYDRKIKVTFDKSSDFWVVKILSQKVKDNEFVTPELNLNCTCEIHLNKKSISNKIDIETLKSNASQINKTEEVYGIARQFDIVHDKFMKGLGVSYLGNDYLLSEIHLSDLAENYTDSFYLHPVYLDCSTLFAFTFHQLDQSKPYIPIFIKTFKVSGELKNKCYVYIRKPKEISPLQDIISNDIEIYDSKGSIVAIFNNFSAKQIRFKDLIAEPNEFDKSKKQNSVIQNPPQNSSPEKIILAKDKIHQKKSIETDLQELIANILDKQINEISKETYFYDMGLDSIHLLQLVQQIEQKLGEQLYPTLMFEFRNISELSNFLVEEHGEKYDVNFTQKDGLVSELLPQETIYYRYEWKEIEKNPLINRQISIEKDFSPILIFDNNKDIQNSLKEKFKSNGVNDASIILVKPGQNYTELKEDIYSINFKEEEDFITLFKSLKNKNLFPNKIIYMWPQENNNDHEEYFKFKKINGIYSLFYISRTVMTQLPKHNIKLLSIYINNNRRIQPYFSAISGFAKSVYWENPKHVYKTVEIQNFFEQNSPLIQSQYSDLIMKEFQCEILEGVDILYKANSRWVKQFVEINSDIENERDNHTTLSAKLKNQGVYLITGGAGGLGLIFAKYLAQEKKAKLILTGRSNLNKYIKTDIKELESLGAEVVYIKSDISKQDDVVKLMQKSKSLFKEINGIIHCAGVIRDSYILMKTNKEMEEVISPKINGTLIIDELTKNENLDFFVLFSSISAVTGNIGQCDYAYANSFLDNFAAMRNELRALGKRKGFTQSINWPLWEEGGMKVNEQYKLIIEQKLGLKPLNTERGLYAFKQGLDSGLSNFIVVEGEPNRIRSSIAYTENQSVSKGNIESYSSDILLKDTNIEEVEKDKLVNKNVIKLVRISDDISKIKNKIEYLDNFFHTINSFENDIEPHDFFHLSTKQFENKIKQILIEINGQTKVEVFIIGKGKPILLIPPFGMTSLIWFYQILNLSSKYQLILINIPGHGLSEMLDNLSLTIMSDNIIAVLDHIKCEYPINVIGASLGGLLAQFLSAKYPKKIASLMLVGSFSHFNINPQFMHDIKKFERFSKLGKEDIDYVINKTRLKYVQRNYPNYMEIIEKSQLNNPFVAVKYISQLSTVSSLEILPQITCPTLICSGKRDTFRGVLFDSSEFDILSSYIPNSNCLGIDEAGHFPYITHFIRFNKIVTANMDNIKLQNRKIK